MAGRRWRPAGWVALVAAVVGASGAAYLLTGIFFEGCPEYADEGIARAAPASLQGRLACHEVGGVASRGEIAIWTAVVVLLLAAVAWLVVRGARVGAVGAVVPALVVLAAPFAVYGAVVSLPSTCTSVDRARVDRSGASGLCGLDRELFME